MENNVIFLLLATLTFAMEAILGQNQPEPRYLLWTRSNPSDSAYYQLKTNDASNLQASPFQENLRTYFIIHGWLRNGETPFVLKIKSNYLTVSNSNVIAVDWRYWAEDHNYLSSVAKVYYVAEMTANLIDWLIKSTALNSSMIHITGHSLGAQVAGMIGKYVTTGTIDRITGLDPAGPRFNTAPVNQRLAATDAAFVDVIHSNGGSLIEGCMGLFMSVGDVDFYPNGGKFQPGCISKRLNISDFTTIAAVCNHERSHELYAESILAGSDQYPNEFWSWPCSSFVSYKFGGCKLCGAKGCLKMGFNANRNTIGSFYLTTNPVSPFAKGL